jgi:uncharacterized membrane protein YhfC
VPFPSTAYLAASLASLVFVVAYPIVVAIVARRRLGVGWRYFLYGAAIFFVFQLLTRVPAVQVIQLAIGPQLEASPVLLWTWLVVLAFSAGVFEEVGRYVGYRVFMRREEKTWPKGVMYGIGHGGLESMLLIGGLMLATLINIQVLASGGLEQVPPEQRELAQQQLSQLASQPAWLPLLGAWERLWTLPIHVALSVIVLQVFRRQRAIWLLWAILAHGTVNLVAIGMAQVLGRSPAASVVTELVVAAFGLAALWTIWRLRDPAPLIDSA